MAFGRGLKRPRPTNDLSNSSDESERENNDNQSEEAHPVQRGTPTTDLEDTNQTVKPLLAEIEPLAKGSGKNPGGSKKWSCKHWKRSFTSSYTRIHYHFLGAPPGKKPQIQRCPVMLTNRTQLQRLRKMVEEAEEKGVSPSLTKSVINNVDKGSPSNRIADSFHTMERHTVNLLVEKAFCANDIPFNVLRNPDFQAMVKGINHAPKDYKSPSYDKARTTLLDECKKDVGKDLSPLKDTWYTNGISIVSDGWTNIKHKTLINVIAANSRSSMFLYSENFEGVEKTGKVIATFLLRAMEEVRASNVLQVLTDNASIVKQSERRSKREALATTVVMRGWREWLRNGDENIRCLGEEVTATIKDENFWEEVENILTITKPIYNMIKFADGEGPKMGEIYERMDCMLGEIADMMERNKHFSDYSSMQEILVQQWEKMNIPMHCVGFSLNPHFYDPIYLRMEAPGGVPRRSPNYDLEVVKGVMNAFEKIGEDENERKILREQLSIFQAKEGIFGPPAARTDAVLMNPISWWSTYGSETPELAEVALKVLSQPISSSSAERVWSTYSYIHNAKRNMLNATRADKLVFIHSNIRLLSRLSESYKKRPCKKWDINPENSWLEDSAVNLEELIWEDDDE